MKLTVIKTLGFSLLASVAVNVFAADPVPAADKAPAAAPGPNPAKQAIAVRKAAFVLINNSFKPIGDASQGKAEYNQADAEKRAKRIVVLTEFLDNTFPDISNLGEPDTKAKAEIWAEKADFDKRLKEFKEHVAVLAQVTATEKTASDAFKDATGAVAKDCKGCHDKYKVK
ncbi:MAG: cytochrome c [Pseudomonadota bacterium]